MTSFIFNFIDRVIQTWVLRLMESVDSSDKLLVSGSSGYDNDQEQDAITIPITSRTPSGEEGYTKENEITVINFDKSINKLYVKYVL